MADQQQSISAAFPAPPPFYKHFTEASLTQLAELRGSLGSVSGSVSGSQKPLHSLLDLPSELQYLQPPVPPSDGKYRSFGEDRMLEAALPPLPSETSVLYSSPPNPANLLDLTRSVLLNFLELVHVLATNPSISEWGPKWDDLRDLFRNAHQAVNEYRPHQAREALILMMEAQVERGRREREEMGELKTRVEELLSGLGEELHERTREDSHMNEIDTGAGMNQGDVHEFNDKIDAERRVWEVLRENIVS